jgi:hypothetical protein
MISNSSENFNEKKWKNTLKKAHNFAVYQKEKVKQQIEDLVKDVDPVELISHVSLLSHFTPEGKPKSDEGSQTPKVHFLVGLCLQNANLNSRCPDNEEIGNTMKLLDEYFNYYFQSLVFESFAIKDQVSETDLLVLSARLQKVTSQINPSIYQFQLEDLLRGVFGKLDDYFIRKVGFTVSDALYFGEKIVKRYERLLNQRVDEARSGRERAERELKDPIKGPQLRAILRRKKINEDEFIESYFGFLMFTSTQEIFVFTAEEFCKEEKIKETEKFKKYLETLSCKFKEVNKDFNSPLSGNAIITRPIISIDGVNYFCPIPPDLIFKIPLIFESFLEDDKRRQAKIWQKYQEKKAHYTENKICQYFTRLFPEQNILKNLKYTYQGQEFEVDILIPYDNKIFIIESKAGAFTEPAKRGAIKRLKSDLRKLIANAYQQGRKTRDYIKSTKAAIFKNEKGTKVFEVNFEPGKLDFFLINVTLEPLMILQTGLKRLEALGLFKENEYPCSINLFELDIITQHIPSPTILIHYLEKRLTAQDKILFTAFDELSFFAWYLEKGNFYAPLTPDGGLAKLVLVGFVDKFDDYYQHGGEPPILRIEHDLVKIIRILETLHPYGYSNIASALLDFDHSTREKILDDINSFIGRTKKDRKRHDFTMLSKELDTGFTFMTKFGRDGLKESLAGYCAIKKYQTKTKRWIGIGRDVSNDDWFANEFVYLDFPWKGDSEMDNVLEKFLQEIVNSNRRKHSI